MDGAILRLLWRLLTGRTVLVLLIAMGLFSWHKVDKTSAVRRAVSGYVADVELTAKKRGTGRVKKAFGRLCIR